MDLDEFRLRYQLDRAARTIRCMYCGEIVELPNGPGVPDDPSNEMLRFLGRHEACANRVPPHARPGRGGAVPPDAW